MRNFDYISFALIFAYSLFVGFNIGAFIGAVLGNILLGGFGGLVICAICAGVVIKWAFESSNNIKKEA